jgi:hypothetical protein
MLLHLFVHKLEEFPLKRFAKTLLQKRSVARYGTMLVDEDEDEHLLANEEGTTQVPLDLFSHERPTDLPRNQANEEASGNAARLRGLAPWPLSLFFFPPPPLLRISNRANPKRPSREWICCRAT